MCLTGSFGLLAHAQSWQFVTEEMRKPLTNSPKLLSFPHFLAEAGRERYRQPWLAGPPAANCEIERTNNEKGLFAQARHLLRSRSDTLSA